MKWVTKSTYVVRETGEEITAANAKKNYVIVNQKSTVEDRDWLKIRHIRYECEHDRQQKLF